jgi:glycosyltransferase involved in cell wall biosynthesis
MKNDLGRGSVANRPLLSIVVTSYIAERLKDIFELLDSIKSQTYKNIEVIFVAERSKELYEKVKDYGDKIGLLSFKVLFNHGELGLSQARNLGVKHANGRIIAFVDDDVILTCNWAEELIATFNMDSDIVGVSGHALPLWEDNSLKWLPKELHWLISCTTWFDAPDLCEVRNVWGHNMAFRREIFEICGLLPTNSGYHRGLMAEDLYFSMLIRAKTGKKLVFNPRVKVLHKVNLRSRNLRFMIDRAHWIGYSRRMLVSIFSNTDKGILRTEHDLLKRTLTSTVLCLFKNPTKYLRVLPVLALVLSSLALGYFIPRR